MRSGFCNSVRVLLGARFVLSVCVSTLAQESPLDDLALRMADALTQSKQKSIAVFAFAAPDEAKALG